MNPERPAGTDVACNPGVSALVREIRLAVRRLLQAPGFTAIALLALSLSIGANTAMFSVTIAVLLRPLPYRNPDELVKVQTVLLESGTAIVSSPPDFYEVRADQRSFGNVGAYYDRAVVLTGRDRPERLRAAVVSAELLAVLGMSPALGRGLTGETRPGVHTGGSSSPTPSGAPGSEAIAGCSGERSVSTGSLT